LPKILKRLRLKEWQSFAASDERWFIFIRLFDAKFLGTASLEIWDRREHRRYGFRKLLVGSPVAQGDSLYPSGRRYKASHAGIELKVDAASGEASALAFAIPKRGPSLTCRLRFSMKSGACAPYSACMPLGLSRAACFSRVLMPASGELVVGDERFVLNGSTAAGMFDDGKAFLPLRHQSDRLSGFGTDASGRRVGFWLSDPDGREPGKFYENRLLLGDRTWPLPPVKVTHPYGPDREWIIQDTEGMVDLVFTPEAPHDFVFTLGLVVIDFHEPFGRFEGVLKNASGDSVAAGVLYGRGETQFIRI